MSGRLLPPLIAGLTAASAGAFARPPPSPSSAAATPAGGGPRREGLVLGAAVGFASLKTGFGLGDGGGNGTSDANVTTAVADLQFGGMLHPRIALLFHLNVARGSDAGAIQHLHASALVGLRLFVTGAFWFELAVGTSGYQARDTVFDTVLEEHAHARVLLMGAGIELYQGRGFTCDLRGNLGWASYQRGFEANFLQGLLGLNWY